MERMVAGEDALAIAARRGTRGQETRHRLHAAAKRLGLPNRAALFAWYGRVTERDRQRAAVAAERDKLCRLPPVERYDMRYVPLALALASLDHTLPPEDA